MTIQEALRAGVARLAAAGIAGAGRDARDLLAAALDVPPARVSLMHGDAVPDAARHRFDAYIDDRAKGRPVAKIVGRRMFWGRHFTVTDDVLDPRPETETLIAAALTLGPCARILDLGTGTGILALTLLAEWPRARAVASDLSPAALEVCGANARRLGVADRLELCEGSWFDPVEGAFDLILSNPPYIAASEMAELSREVRDHDPALALSPGGDGLDAYRAICARARTHMKPGATILLEIGWQQGAAVGALLDKAGFSAVEVRPDMDGRDRLARAIAPASRPKPAR